MCFLCAQVLELTKVLYKSGRRKLFAADNLPHKSLFRNKKDNPAKYGRIVPEMGTLHWLMNHLDAIISLAPDVFRYAAASWLRALLELFVLVFVFPPSWFHCVSPSPL